jgi:hypothetical protein
MDRATYPEVVATLMVCFGRAALFDASLFGLALRGVCLAARCHHPRRCALTLSPVGPHPFTHYPQPQLYADGPLAGLLSVALVVTRGSQSPSSDPEIPRCPAVSGLAALQCSDFPLPNCLPVRQRPPSLSLASRFNYTKQVFNTYSTKTINRDK